MVRLRLTTDEWRRLRVWAAEEDSSMQLLVGDVVRRALAGKPHRGF